MQHADPTAEPLLGLREELVGQGNLRDQKNDVFPVPQRIFGRGQIDFGLSAAGHAVQQKDGETLSIEGAAYFVTRGLLCVGQPRTGGFGYSVGQFRLVSRQHDLPRTWERFGDSDQCARLQPLQRLFHSFSGQPPL